MAYPPKPNINGRYSLSSLQIVGYKLSSLLPVLIEFYSLVKLSKIIAIHG